MRLHMSAFGVNGWACLKVTLCLPQDDYPSQSCQVLRLLIYSSNLGQFKYIKTNEYADTMRQNGKPQA